MKILFTGDSITKGHLGASFVNLFTQEFATGNYTNLGADGDTMAVIIQRLLTHLKSNNNYDIIVVQGGYNDILLPSFEEKGTLFKFAFNHQIKKGQKPLNSSIDFYDALKSMVKEVKHLYSGRLVVMTLGCLNEKIDTKLNEKRQDFNTIIRQITIEENILLADAGKLFDAFLSSKKQTNYCVESFWAVTFTDVLFSVFKKGIDFLSHKRKLFLTIDGVHLNNLGASFFSNSIKQIIK